MRWLWFVGPIHSDDFEYLSAAHRMTAGTSPIPVTCDVFWARIAFTVPIAISMAVFGVGEWSAVTYPVACSLGEVVLAYLLARRYGYLCATVAGVVGLGWVGGLRQTWPYVAWWGMLLASWNFWPMQLRPYVPACIGEARHFTMIVLPTAVLAAYVGTALARRHPRTAAACGLIVGTAHLVCLSASARRSPPRGACARRCAGERRRRPWAVRCGSTRSRRAERTIDSPPPHG